MTSSQQDAAEQTPAAASPSRAPADVAELIMGGRGAVSAEPANDETPSERVICSSRGCQRTAIWAVLWNNPKLHTPDRRKQWVACDEHRETLADFLRLRGFLRDIQPLGTHRTARDSS